MKKNLEIFLLLFSFFLLPFAFSQQYNFRTYSLEEGIAQSQILSMCRDSRGNIWFGTYGSGISIFNGTEFNNLTIQDGLVNNAVRVIFEDSKENIWIGTDGGLSVHDGYEIKNYTVGAGISSGKIQAIAEDKNGRIWLGTKTGGINIYKDSNFDIILSDDGLLNNNIKALFRDNTGQIWASCYGYGITVFNERQTEGTNKPLRAEISYLSTANGLLDDFVNCFYQEENGNMWIGSEKGITIINDVSNIEKAKAEYTMTSHPVSSFYSDEQGNLWIGTAGGGVMKFTGKNFLNITEKNGLSNNLIYQITGDNSGGVWIGTNGGGACHYSKDAFISYSRTDGLSGNVIMSVQEDLYGNIWAGSYGSGISKFDGNSFTSDFPGFSGKYIYTIKEDASGNLWIGTHRDGLYKYDGQKFTHYFYKEGLPLNEIYCIFQDKNENIWIGGTGGVYLFTGNVFGSFGKEAGLGKDKVYCIADDKEGNIWFATEHGIVKKTKTKIFNYSEKDGLVSNAAGSLINDKNGNIWIGTENGISYYDGFKFHNYTTTDGLTSNNIFSLIFDDDENLIAGTEQGLDKIFFTTDKQIQRVVNYSSEEGFIGIECNLNAAYKDKHGNFWFGTVKGLTKYNPQEEVSEEQNLQTHITEISLFFEETDWKNYADSLTRWNNLPVKLQLPYDKNHLTFQFFANNLNMSEKANFRFMLDGFDKAWSPVSAKREATYSNLPHGKYIFKVKAFSGELESPVEEFSFSVSPPFWKTWWFYFLAACFAVTGGYLTVYLRTKNLQRTTQRLEEMVRLRTEEILRQKEELENLSIVASETVQGVLIANGEGKVEWMNDGLQRMTGYGFDEIKLVFGETLHEISSHPDIRRILRTVEETKKSVQYDSMHRTKDGREQWVTGTVTPVFENSHLKKMVIIYSDITERKQIEEEIRKKNKDITESILYAKQIQEAVLPQKEKLTRLKSDSFVFHLPKDIVSGDFYWFTQHDGILFIAAADCTGHGVPGALMSMIGNEFLYQITYQAKIHKPHLALEELDRKIKQSLRQVGDEKEAKDGMDIALVSIKSQASNSKPQENENLKSNLGNWNLENDTLDLEFAGAYRPLVIIRSNGDFVEYEGEKFSIGGFMKSDKSFKTHYTQLHKGDSVYLFTDGILDQFGGEKGKKFLMKRFKETLLEICCLPMQEQKTALEKKFNQWKKNYKQTDDVLVIGVRL